LPQKAIADEVAVAQPVESGHPGWLALEYTCQHGLSGNRAYTVGLAALPRDEPSASALTAPGQGPR
jgi:hypothetical protein